MELFIILNGYTNIVRHISSMLKKTKGLEDEEVYTLTRQQCNLDIRESSRLHKEQ